MSMIAEDDEGKIVAGTKKSKILKKYNPESGLVALCQALKKKESLESLSFNYEGSYGMSENGLEALSETISSIRNLRELELCFLNTSPIDKDHCRSFLKGMSGMENLESVKLDMQGCIEASWKNSIPAK